LSVPDVDPPASEVVPASVVAASVVAASVVALSLADELSPPQADVPQARATPSRIAAEVLRAVCALRVTLGELRAATTIGLSGSDRIPLAKTG
jgi:hypothetical protein